MLSAYFAGLWLAYLGMLALCQGLERHYKQVWNKAPAPALRRTLRASGWLALGLSLLLCAKAWGWAMGPVGWFGQMALAGLLVALLLAYRPRWAVWLPLPAGVLLAVGWLVNG